MATDNNIYDAVLNIIGVADKMTNNNASQLTDAQKVALKNLSNAMKSGKVSRLECVISQPVTNQLKVKLHKGQPCWTVSIQNRKE